MLLSKSWTSLTSTNNVSDNIDLDKMMSWTNLWTKDRQIKRKIMWVNHIFGELIALAIPFGASYLTTKFLPFAPLFSKTTTIPANLAFLPSELYTYLQANNDIAISLIPTMIYIIGRVYFEIMYFITSLIPIPKIGKYLINTLILYHLSHSFPSIAVS